MNVDIIILAAGQAPLNLELPVTKPPRVTVENRGAPCVADVVSSTPTSSASYGIKMTLLFTATAPSNLLKPLRVSWRWITLN